MWHVCSLCTSDVDMVLHAIMYVFSICVVCMHACIIAGWCVMPVRVGMNVLWPCNAHM